MHIREVSWNSSEETLIAIRTEVFVKEQGVPRDLEIDGLDQTSYHFLATTSQGEDVGTARLLETGQIGRMAVLEPHRGSGIGRQLLECAVAKALQLNFAEIFLHAQTHALDFYSRNGFEVYGEEFDDAGIPHRAMRYNRSPN
ncbi:MAG: GNAT family N-acetyltransferase [Gammaproteobacteria bacterium]|nr:GNAT family N-acetyltransferase [Gammaproteobacteria bacterium]